MTPIRNLDTSLLRTFVAVAECRSMTASAKHLLLTQGAVSQKIARLEGLSRQQLVIGGRQGMMLTPAGERLLTKAKQMLAVNDEIRMDTTGDAVDGNSSARPACRSCRLCLRSGEMRLKPNLWRNRDYGGPQ
ncbi:LysR family transcriptional regulator [Rhizobium sp. NZLR11]|uniref:LysR family transcriptional regulator n=1 Tax=Rhizobium sp. NZLR11 TaxID=2731098 RepID=UPI001C82F841|nr:LysR family transcriptional regulator [Rhizobium sp. NZLR11]